MKTRVRKIKVRKSRKKSTGGAFFFKTSESTKKKPNSELNKSSIETKPIFDHYVNDGNEFFNGEFIYINNGTSYITSYSYCDGIIILYSNDKYLLDIFSHFRGKIYTSKIFIFDDDKQSIKKFIEPYTLARLNIQTYLKNLN